MGYDFTRGLSAQFDAEEATGSALLDSSGGSNDLPDTLSVPGGITGIIGDGRGELATGDKHFTLNFAADNAYDIIGKTPCTWAGWVQVNNAEQSYSFNMHDPTTAGRQALILIPRETNFEATPGPYVAMADGISSFNWKQMKVQAQTIALNVWQYMAGGYDAVRNKVFGAWGRSVGEFYYNEIDGFAAGFGYTGTGGTTKVGNWNAEAGTGNIRIDHSLWFNGRALSERELRILWNNHEGLPFDRLKRSSAGIQLYYQ